MPLEAFASDSTDGGPVAPPTWVEAVKVVTIGALRELAADADVAVAAVVAVAVAAGVAEARRHRRDTSFALGVRWVD